MDPSSLDHGLSANATMATTPNDSASQEIAIAPPPPPVVVQDLWDINLSKPQSPEASLEAYDHVSSLLRSRHEQNRPLPPLVRIAWTDGAGPVVESQELAPSSNLGSVVTRSLSIANSTSLIIDSALHDASTIVLDDPLPAAESKAAVLEQLVKTDALKIRALARISPTPSFFVKRLIVQLVDRIISTVLGRANSSPHSTLDGTNIILTKKDVYEWLMASYQLPFGAGTMRNIRSTWGAATATMVKQLEIDHKVAVENGIQDVKRAKAIDLLNKLIDGAPSLPPTVDNPTHCRPDHVYASTSFSPTTTVLVLPLVSDPQRDVYKLMQVQWKKLASGDFSCLTPDGSIV